MNIFKEKIEKELEEFLYRDRKRTLLTILEVGVEMDMELLQYITQLSEEQIEEIKNEIK